MKTENTLTKNMQEENEKMKQNIQKLVTAVTGHYCNAEAIDEKALMEVIKKHLSRSEALVISWCFGLDGNEPTEIKDIPLKKICASKVYPTQANLRRLRATALTKLNTEVLLKKYYKP